MTDCEHENRRERDWRMAFADDGREERFEWDVSKFPPLCEGRIGLRVMPCRISRIRDFKVYTR